MRLQLILVAFVILVCSCSHKASSDSGNIPSDNAGDTAQVTPDLQGQWYIENIVLSDSVNVRPEEEVPGSNQYITFEEKTFSIMTNCNSITGSYSLHGDSILMGEALMTEMGCDNVATEEALRKILHRIVAVDVENDSIVRLNCEDPSSYIVLRKAPVKVKCHVE